MITSKYRRILKNSTKSDAELYLLAQSYAALQEQFKAIYIHTFFRFLLLNFFTKESAINQEHPYTIDLPRQLLMIESRQDRYSSLESYRTLLFNCEKNRQSKS